MTQPTPDQWAKLGPIYVTQAHVAAAQERGEVVRVYPEGMEALGEYGAKAVRTSGRDMGERLSSVGTYPMSGEVDMDANPRLTPDVWRGYQDTVGVVDQMCQEDPVCKALRSVYTLPILRSHWKVEPAGDDRNALEEAEFIRANFFELVRGGFYQFVEQAASAVWRGFSLFEIVARFDRESKQVRLDQLSPMLPRTVYEWKRYEDGRWGVTQNPYIGDVEDRSGSRWEMTGASLAPDKLLHFVWDPDGDSPEGTSILRPCYAGWKSRRLYLKLEGAGYDRGAFGVPYCELSPQSRPGDAGTVNEILRELRTGSRAWASFPPGYTLKFADFPMKGAEIREARIALGQDMARAALAPFLFTGEKAGAFSMLQGQQDFFLMSIQSAADMIGKVLSHGPHSLVQRLCKWNYERSEGFPKITPGAVSIGDPKQLVEAIKVASESGSLLPDRGIEEAVRSALGLPEMPELESKEQQEHRLRNEQTPEVRTDMDKAADSALNGAQVTSAMAIVQAAAAGEITRASAVGMIANFFNLPREVAEEILGGPASPKTDEAAQPEAEVEVEDKVERRTQERPATAPKVAEVTDDQEEVIKEEAKAMEKLAEKLPGRRAVSGRELRPEELMVRMDETLAPMEGVKRAMAQAAEDWREAIADKYADRVARAGDLLQMRSADVPDLGKLGEAFRIELRRAYRAGTSSVSEEMDRIASNPELGPALEAGDFEVTREDIEVALPDETAVLSQMRFTFSPTSPGMTGLSYLLALQEEEPAEDEGQPVLGRKVKAGTPEAEGESVSDEIDPEEAIENVARTSALAAGDRVRDASIRAVQSASIGGVLETAAIVEVVSGAVLALSPGADLVQAQRDTNTIFGLGRMQEARTQGAEKGIRSAMLESSTCEVCLSKDGAEFPIEDLDEWACPDPGCLGGDQCNCITIFMPAT